MNFSDFKLIRLSSDLEIKSFNCGDSDLNDFLYNDSKDYQKELLVVTYIIESDMETVAFFSLLNDKITFEIETKAIRHFGISLIEKTYPTPKEQQRVIQQ